MLMLAAPARAADPPKLAVFDFEMIDTSLEAEMRVKRPDEQARLLHGAFAHLNFPVLQ